MRPGRIYWFLELGDSQTKLWTVEKRDKRFIRMARVPFFTRSAGTMMAMTPRYQTCFLHL